jgi:hypothetical protein
MARSSFRTEKRKRRSPISFPIDFTKFISEEVKESILQSYRVYTLGELINSIPNLPENANISNLTRKQLIDLIPNEVKNSIAKEHYLDRELLPYQEIATTHIPFTNLASRISNESSDKFYKIKNSNIAEEEGIMLSEEEKDPFSIFMAITIIIASIDAVFFSTDLDKNHAKQKPLKELFVRAIELDIIKNLQNLNEDQSIDLKIRNSLNEFIEHISFLKEKYYERFIEEGNRENTDASEQYYRDAISEEKQGREKRRKPNLVERATTPSSSSPEPSLGSRSA